MTTLQDKIDAYKKGDRTHRAELIVRCQKASGFILDRITVTPGGWGVLNDMSDPQVEQAKDLLITVMGEINFRNLVTTHSILRSINGFDKQTS